MDILSYSSHKCVKYEFDYTVWFILQTLGMYANAKHKMEIFRKLKKSHFFREIATLLILVEGDAFFWK